jgi:hypothetical protein
MKVSTINLGRAYVHSARKAGKQIAYHCARLHYASAADIVYGNLGLNMAQELMRLPIAELRNIALESGADNGGTKREVCRAIVETLAAQKHADDFARNWTLYDSSIA